MIAVMPSFWEITGRTGSIENKTYKSLPFGECPSKIFTKRKNSTEDFKNVECQILQLSETGKYVKNSTQTVSVDDGFPQITIKSADGYVEQRTIDMTSSTL